MEDEIMEWQAPEVTVFELGGAQLGGGPGSDGSGTSTS